MMEASAGILDLFPFVCGICDAKFNGIPIFLSHIQEHKVINKYLHCCFGASNNLNQPSKEDTLYTCSKCRLMFPSLCTLYKHLLVNERITDFVFKSEDKTAYELNAESIDDATSEAATDKADTSHMKDDNNVNWPDSDEYGGSTDSCGEELLEDVARKNKLRTKDVSENDNSKSCENSLEGNDKSDVDNKVEHSSVRTDKQYDSEFDETNVDVDQVDESKTSAKKVSSKNKVRKRRAESSYPCEICGGIYKYSALRSHMVVHAEQTVPCDQCHLKFKSKERLSQHREYVHATESKFTCHECGKSFKALPYLRQHGLKHMTFEERRAECSICHKMFKDKRAVRKHMITHSEERPYKCSQCDKSFKRSRDLMGHEEGVHLALEQYPCLECNKKMKTKNALNKHLKIHQPPKYFCEICGKSFVMNSNKRIHMRVHYKEIN